LQSSFCVKNERVSRKQKQMSHFFEGEKSANLYIQLVAEFN
jgi:hypothetical protein